MMNGEMLNDERRSFAGLVYLTPKARRSAAADMPEASFHYEERGGGERAEPGLPGANRRRKAAGQRRDGSDSSERLDDVPRSAQLSHARSLAKFFRRSSSKSQPLLTVQSQGMVNTSQHKKMFIPSQMISTPEEIGVRLYKIRILLGRVGRGGQKRFAEDLGEDSRTYNVWEAGRGRPPPDRVALIIDKFLPALTLDYIYLGNERGLTADLIARLRLVPDPPPKRPRLAKPVARPKSAPKGRSR